jgi:hypothetical protein
MQMEVAASMAPVGINFEWRSLPEPEVGKPAVALAVITFKGQCTLGDLESPPSHKAVALGITHISNGLILPYSELDCDRIRYLIRLELLEEAPDQQERLYGRAIARVLAHELYHVIANTKKHGSRGISKASLSASDLVMEVFQFDKRDSLAMRSGQIVSWLQNPSDAISWRRGAADHTTRLASDREAIAGNGTGRRAQMSEK